MHPTMTKNSSCNNNRNSYHFPYQMKRNIQWQLWDTWYHLKTFSRDFLLPGSIKSIFDRQIKITNLERIEQMNILLKIFRRCHKVLSSSRKICSFLLVSNNNNYFSVRLFCSTHSRFLSLPSFLDPRDSLLLRFFSHSLISTEENLYILLPPASSNEDLSYSKCIQDTNE